MIWIGCAPKTKVQIRKEVRTEDERHTESSSYPHGRVADFDLGTHQNMELRVTFHLRVKSAMNHGLSLQKRRPLFIGMHNETSRTIALGGSNPKMSALAVRT